MRYLVWKTETGVWRARSIGQGTSVFASGDSSVEALCNLLERLAERPAQSVA
jgi:hypothetical protein